MIHYVRMYGRVKLGIADAKVVTRSVTPSFLVRSDVSSSHRTIRVSVEQGRSNVAQQQPLVLASQKASFRYSYVRFVRTALLHYYLSHSPFRCANVETRTSHRIGSHNTTSTKSKVTAGKQLRRKHTSSFFVFH